MAGRFTVESIFKGIDRVSGPVKKMGKNVSKITRKMRNSFRRVSNSIGKLSGAAKTAGVGIAAGLALGTAAMVGVINTGAEFEQTLVNAAAKFPEGIKKGSKAFLELEEVAARVGKTTEFTASEAASGLNFLAMAGFNAQQSIKSLPGLVDLATASSVDLATAADIASDTMGAFGLAADDATQRATNLARINDVLAKVTTTANTNMEDLFEAIKKGGPQFKASGASIETFGALTGTLANSSLKASEAGTGLRNFFLRLANPAGAASEALEEMGIKTADSSGNFRDAIDILADLEKGLGGMGTAQRAAALDTIFGKKTINTVNVLLEVGSEKLRTYRTELEGAGGASKTMAETMRDTTQGSINTMKSAFEGLTLTLFNTNKAGIGGLITGITDMIRTVDSFLEKNKEMVAGLSGDLFETILAGLKIFGLFVGVVVALKTALLVAQGITLAYNAALILFNVTMGILKAGMVVATAAQWALNLAMKASPIGTIVTLIGGLIAVGALLIANWDTVKAFFVDTWGSIVDTVRTSVESISGLIETVTQPFKDLTAGVSGIKAKVSNFFGFGSDSKSQVVTPQEKISRSISESRETSSAEVTIKDDTGRAEVTKSNFKGLRLQQSGAF